MSSLQDVCRSRYLLFRNLRDCGFSASRASLAVDVLLGREDDDEDYRPAEVPTFEPSAEDWADYTGHLDRIEELERIAHEDRMSVYEGDDPDYISDRDLMAAGLPVG